MHASKQDFAVIITTIQTPTSCVQRLHDSLAEHGGRMYVLGDKKGPSSFDLEDVNFYCLAAQQDLPFTLARTLPVGHYARKNLGYLLAVADQAPMIYETDDDNAPNALWKPRERRVPARRVSSQGWANVYRMFSDSWIWPRGYPLSRLQDPLPEFENNAEVDYVDSPIHQGLADLAPDVDAIWRMVYDKEFYFDSRPSVELGPGAWCPFNSQTTWWWPEAYPLLYLPSYCSFRMTDIWRSFIAQRCLWEMGYGIVFHAAEVIQERNQHCLARDFEHEVPGYVRNQELIDELMKLKLESGIDAVGENMRVCYQRLVECGFFDAAELGLVDSWLSDLAACQAATASKTQQATDATSRYKRAS